MIIIPAIDIIDGMPVRLYKGDYGKKEIVGDSIERIAEEFQKAGAEYIHLVDLDGAKSGRLKNKNIIINLAKNLSVKIETGGGIRTFNDIDYLVSNGISRVILGTAAIEDFEMVKRAADQYGDKIAVGVDCKNGYLCGRGWLEKSKLYYLDFIEKLTGLGIDNVIVTDIDKDGTLNGTNIEMIKKIKEKFNIKVTASGGIKDLEDIRKLKELDIYGAIAGKSIYSGSLSLKEAINICKE